MVVATAPERIDAGVAVLRRHRVDDAPALVDAINASFEHLHPWMPWAATPATIASNTAFLVEAVAHFDAGTEFGYVLLDPTERHIVGGAGLHRRRGPEIREIGYWVHVDWTRRGIASASARALAELAFRFDGVERVEIRCDAGNAASAGVPRSPDAPGESGREMVWTTYRPMRR